LDIKFSEPISLFEEIILENEGETIQQQQKQQ
jgi:hypothetical protein